MTSTRSLWAPASTELTLQSHTHPWPPWPRYVQRNTYPLENLQWQWRPSSVCSSHLWRNLQEREGEGRGGGWGEGETQVTLSSFYRNQILCSWRVIEGICKNSTKICRNFYHRKIPQKCHHGNLMTSHTNDRVFLRLESFLHSIHGAILCKQEESTSTVDLKKCSLLF